jgi:methylmalonyl-CoA/ethylmalonyl-CoA epimerase
VVRDGLRFFGFPAAPIRAEFPVSDQPHIAHIGIAVTSVADALAFYRDVLGLQPKPAETADGAVIVSLPFGGPEVELLEPGSPDSPIARFLARRGPGIHHVCYEVPPSSAAAATAIS